MKLKDWLEQFMVWQAGKASERDMERYAAVLAERMGERELDELKRSDVMDFAASRRRHVSAQTVAHELSFLRRSLAAAIDDGLINRNPVGRIPKPHNERLRWLTDTEESALMLALEDSARPLVLVALHTGLRQGEQFAMRWEHVDLDAGTLRVPRTKTGYGRVVPLNETASAALAQVRGNGIGWVWRSAHGQQANSYNVMTRQFRPAVARAMISDFRWHDLRHTFACRLVLKGVDLRTVADLLGHRSLAMTMRYVHLGRKAARAAVLALDERARGDSNPRQTA